MEKTVSVKIPRETLELLKEVKERSGVNICYSIKIAVENYYNTINKNLK